MDTTSHTYLEIAGNRNLWNTYVDPAGLTTDSEWESETPAQRVKFIEACFGKESPTLDPMSNV